ncbi:hypothetical protein [Pseudomonas nitroreducens]|uniref:hypothetical protein n=1 Tax=Pseudomonas nitroreducens TaxID=46680 RepID=UPI001131FC0A|nr:hypothetical protein [Pseudomonas nitroreducens]
MIATVVKPGGDTVGWVQAIGSIVAVIGAGAFPYFHESHRERRQQARTRRLLHMLAQRQESELLKLWKVVHDSVHDFGAESIGPYLEKREQLRWPSHVAALDSITISDLDPFCVMALGDLKVGAAFAVLICDRLNDWNVIGDQEIVDARTLFDHYQVAQVVTEGVGHLAAGDWDS